MRAAPLSVLTLALLLTSIASPVTLRADDAVGSGHGMLILERLPISAEWYRPEAAALIEEGVVERFGVEEWRAVVLAQELHQHVGIYTILGAKMGVLARELLEAPARAVEVTLDTGGNGPMTCATDGIQASLASTYGQSLVRVEHPEKPVLAATFEFEDRVLRLTLKPEYREVMQGHIESAREEHGDLSPGYFGELERISYRVWSEFDRNEVFAVEWLED
jgi:pyrimidine-specific ribonucleoside hydrolase